MKRKRLLSSLNDIYGDLENILDETFASAAKKLQKTIDTLGAIIQEIEDDGVESEEKSEE